MRKTEFREFVSVRLPALGRVAYLLSGDKHVADDLVSIAIGKLFGRGGGFVEPTFLTPTCGGF